MLAFGKKFPLIQIHIRKKSLKIQLTENCLIKHGSFRQ